MRHPSSDDNTWRNVFQRWPGSVPKQGLLVTTFGETISFVNFLVSGTAVLVERDMPDATGARKVIIDYGAVQALKLPDAGSIVRYEAFGFQSPM